MRIKRERGSDEAVEGREPSTASLKSGTSELSAVSLMEGNRKSSSPLGPWTSMLSGPSTTGETGDGKTWVLSCGFVFGRELMVVKDDLGDVDVRSGVTL